MRIIKDAAHVYSHRLTLIFNNYIRNGKFPDTLKYTDITQVFKKVDTTDKSNYRPRSILSNFSKIFEKLIYNQVNSYTAQAMKFSIKDFFSKYGQSRRELQIWSHLLKKSLMENFIFCAVILCFIIYMYLAFNYVKMSHKGLVCVKDIVKNL